MFKKAKVAAAFGFMNSLCAIMRDAHRSIVQRDHRLFRRDGRGWRPVRWRRRARQAPRWPRPDRALRARAGILPLLGLVDGPARPRPGPAHPGPRPVQDGSAWPTLSGFRVPAGLPAPLTLRPFGPSDSESDSETALKTGLGPGPGGVAESAV